MSIKLNLLEIQLETNNEIKNLVIFAEASKYIYNHFSTSAESIRNDKPLTKIKYEVKVEDIIELILNDTITTKLYENVIVRAYGVLELFIFSLATLLVNHYPTNYIGNKTVKLTQLFDGDIEKLKEGNISTIISEITSNKNMYDSLIAIIEPFGIDLSDIKNYQAKIKDVYALRNLIVHKNCIIDQKFLDSYSIQNDYEVGSILNIEYKNMTNVVNSLYQFVKKTYEALNKYNWK